MRSVPLNAFQSRSSGSHAPVTVSDANSGSRQELEAERHETGADGGAHGGVALPDLGQGLLLHHLEGHVELEHHGDGGRPGRLARLGAGLVGGQVEVELGHLRHGRGLPGARRDRDEGEPGRDHPGLLRAADDDVEAPGVGLERNGTKAADRVDDDQRVRGDRLDGRRQLGDRVRDGRRGLVLGEKDGLPRAAGAREPREPSPDRPPCPSRTTAS